MWVKHFLFCLSLLVEKTSRNNCTCSSGRISLTCFSISPASFDEAIPEAEDESDPLAAV
jgi:hypothetical protein